MVTKAIIAMEIKTMYATKIGVNVQRERMENEVPNATINANKNVPTKQSTSPLCGLTNGAFCFCTSLFNSTKCFSFVALTTGKKNINVKYVPSILGTNNIVDSVAL